MNDIERENGKGCGSCKHLRGISCDARNCVYHDGDCYCTADKIAVGPAHATSSTETACATFQKKQF